MSPVEFHFDFGSPNAYLAHLVIPEIERRTGAKFEYVPVLLSGVFKLTGNRSPAESLAGIKNKPEYERLETERFLKRHGITRYRRNPFFPVNTLTITRGAVAAQKLGIYERYIDEIYCQMWSEPKKLDDPEVLRRALIEAGFDAGYLLALSQNRRCQEQATRQHIAQPVLAEVDLVADKEGRRAKRAARDRSNSHPRGFGWVG